MNTLIIMAVLGMAVLVVLGLVISRVSAPKRTPRRHRGSRSGQAAVYGSAADGGSSGHHDGSSGWGGWGGDSGGGGWGGGDSGGGGGGGGGGCGSG